MSVLLPLALAVAPAASAPFAMLAPAAKIAAGPRIITEANEALARPPRARADLHTEGTLPGKGIREASIYAKADQPAVLAVAAAWRATRDRRYLAAADRYLAAWAGIYRPSFNPIDETGFDQMMLATDLTRADLSLATRAAIDALWRRMAAGYLDAMDGKPVNAETNWQSHRVKLATMAAYSVGDPALIARARAAYRRQIAANIHADGSVFDFTERDALHYVTYDLDPLLMAALAAHAHAENWYAWRNPAGSSLAGAVRWLIPYALGTKTHVEFVNSRIQFDRDRAKAGQTEYALHLWDRRNAVATFTLASPFDSQARAIAGRVSRETNRPAPYWMAWLG